MEKKRKPKRAFYFLIYFDNKDLLKRIGHIIWPNSLGFILKTKQAAVEQTLKLIVFLQIDEIQLLKDTN